VGKGVEAAVTQQERRLVVRLGGTGDPGLGWAALGRLRELLDLLNAVCEGATEGPGAGDEREPLCQPPFEKP